jgi:hypothetical protein
LFVTLKEMGLAPELEVPLREGGAEYVVDLAIPCREGTLAIALGERPAPEAALRLEATGQAQDDVQRIVEAVERLGGVSR